MQPRSSVAHGNFIYFVSNQILTVNESVAVVIFAVSAKRVGILTTTHRNVVIARAAEISAVGITVVVVVDAVRAGFIFSGLPELSPPDWSPQTVTFSFREQSKSPQSTYPSPSLSMPSEHASSVSSGSRSPHTLHPHCVSTQSLHSRCSHCCRCRCHRSKLHRCLLVARSANVTSGLREQEKSSQSVKPLPSLSSPSEHVTSLSSGVWHSVTHDLQPLSSQSVNPSPSLS